MFSVKFLNKKKLNMEIEKHEQFKKKNWKHYKNFCSVIIIFMHFIEDEHPQQSNQLNITLTKLSKKKN